MVSLAHYRGGFFVFFTAGEWLFLFLQNRTVRVKWYYIYNKENRLLEVIRMIGEDKGFTVLTCKAYDQDRVDCYIAAPPKISPTQIVKYLKGISGNILLREFPDLREKLYRGELWNGSYFAETIGSPSESELDRYTERQTDHQL